MHLEIKSVSFRELQQEAQDDNLNMANLSQPAASREVNSTELEIVES